MKQEWWEKKLREDAEVRIQDTDKDWNESYLRPDSSQFLPRKFRARILAQYGAAAAAALVIIAGAGVLIHRSGAQRGGDSAGIRRYILCRVHADGRGNGGFLQGGLFPLRQRPTRREQPLPTPPPKGRRP